MPSQYGAPKKPNDELMVKLNAMVRPDQKDFLRLFSNEAVVVRAALQKFQDSVEASEDIDINKLNADLVAVDKQINKRQ